MPRTKLTDQRQDQARAVSAQGAGKPAPGARLAAAFEAVERFPVLIESRARVMQAATAETARIGEIVEAVESDVGTDDRRAARRQPQRPAAGGVASVPDAVERARSPPASLAIAGTAPAFDFFEANGSRELRPERFRVHALATQHAADRIGRAVGWSDRDELAVAALLHDIGRLVLSKPPSRARRATSTPPRAPRSSASAKNASSSASTTPWSAASWPGAGTCRSGSPWRSSATTPRTPTAWRGWSRLADMVAHYAQGEAVTPDGCAVPPSAAASTRDGLRELLYDLPYPRSDAPRSTEPCPLSARELDVLSDLAEGKVYKQIAGEMQLSVSTVRTHLHNVYGKIGAVDRAQAVLTARDRGWI